MNGPVCISSFTVSKAGEWVYFQIKLPCGAPPVVGLNFTVLEWASTWGFKSGPYIPPTAGEVKLRWQEHGDVFFAAPVDFDDQAFPDIVLVGGVALPFGFSNGLWDFGWRKEPHRVEIEQGNTVIFGLYRDHMIQLSGTLQPYTVRVYLYFPPKEKGGPS